MATRMTLCLALCLSAACAHQRPAVEGVEPVVAAHERWLAGGERSEVALRGGAPVRVFNRVEGEGPWVTALHGFPTSSWDWAGVSRRLKDRYRLLALDWLGFGDSDKPADHRYTIAEQADLLEAIWRRHGVKETFLLSHDYGDTVTQELLRREAAGALGVRLRGVVVLNGSVYGALNRPLLIQQLLQVPVVGGLVSRLVSEERFGESFRRIFSLAHPITGAELHAHWRAIRRRDGNLIYDRLVHHYGEQRDHGAPWEAAMERSRVPLRFVWGMADPVSGKPIAEQLRRRIPGAVVRELEDVGHYPQLEVPALVAFEADAFFAEVARAEAGAAAR